MMIEDMKKTELIYLKDTYLFECEAEILDIVKSEKGEAIILNKTIFYPQRGGQPTDNGVIVSKSFPERKFVVERVRLDESGVVWHFGKFENENSIFGKGNKVVLKIDEERRILNARIHSAGHLIVYATSLLKLNNLIPLKGFHFPEGPYVEFEGTVENSKSMISDLENILNRLVKQDLKIEVKYLDSKEALKANVEVPKGKSARVVRFGDFSPIGCGGTHVKSTSEIGKIKIRKIKSNKGRTRIAYAVE